MLKQKVKSSFYYSGGAMIYAIAFIIIASIIAVLLLSDFSFSNNFLSKTRDKKEALNYAYQGLELLSDGDIEYEQEYAYELKPNYKVLISKSIWGCYEKYSCFTVKNDDDTILRKIAIVGNGRDTNNRDALFVNGSNSYISISDNVYLNGKCYVPAGVLRKSKFDKKQFLPEKVYNSDDVSIELRNLHVLNFIKKEKHRQKIIHISEAISNSFFHEALEYSADTILVSGNISGNIVLEGDYIKVEPNTNLQNVLIKAKSIHVQANSYGNAQLFFAHELFIGDSVTLEYPSVIFFNQEEGLGHIKPKVKIGQSVNFLGDVYLIGNSNLISPVVDIDKSSSFVGYIHSNYDLTFYGKCYGCIRTNGFITRNGGLVQRNMLKDIRIDIDSLPFYNVHSILYPITNNRKIVQWCN